MGVFKFSVTALDTCRQYFLASCLCFWAETLADYDPMSVYTTFVVSYVTVLQKCKTLGGAQMIL